MKNWWKQWKEWRKVGIWEQRVNLQNERRNETNKPKKKWRELWMRDRKEEVNRKDTEAFRKMEERRNERRNERLIKKK